MFIRWCQLPVSQKHSFAFCRGTFCKFCSPLWRTFMGWKCGEELDPCGPELTREEENLTACMFRGAVTSVHPQLQCSSLMKGWDVQQLKHMSIQPERELLAASVWAERRVVQVCSCSPSVVLSLSGVLDLLYILVLQFILNESCQHDECLCSDVMD